MKLNYLRKITYQVTNLITLIEAFCNKQNISGTDCSDVIRLM